MPFDLEGEIARRLNVSRDEVAPVLEAVIERVRQQVSHYGYARLAGLGTFRGQNGRLSFEPDSVLSDEVNVRFAGLEEFIVEAPPLSDADEELIPEEPLEDFGRVEKTSDTDELEDWGPETHAGVAGQAEDVGDRVDDEITGDDPDTGEIDHGPEEDDAEYGESPGEDYERSVPGTDDAVAPDEESHVDETAGVETPEITWDEPRDFPAAAEEESDLDEWEETADDAGLEEWPETTDDADLEEWEETTGEADLEEWPETADEADLEEWEETADDADFEEWIDARDETERDREWKEEPSDADDEDVEAWLEQPEAEHPLGPVPGPPFEEADFSVLDEQREVSPESIEERDVDHDLEEVEPQLEMKDEEDDYLSDDLFEEEGTPTPSVEWNPPDEQIVPGLQEEEEEEEEERRGPRSGPTHEAKRSKEEEEEEEEEEGVGVGVGSGAIPHERLRQPSERRHAAARATGGEVAGGNRNAIWIGVGVLVLVAAAAVVYFSMTPSVTSDPPTAAEERDGPLPVDTSAAAGGVASSGDASAADTTVAEAPAAPAPVESFDPLRSTEGIDPSAGGYTLVVYSETSEAGAENVMAQFREDGFRTGVLEDQDNATTRYRVGVGQFASLDEAVEVRDRLAGNQLPDDAWVIRIR